MPHKKRAVQRKACSPHRGDCKLFVFMLPIHRFPYYTEMRTISVMTTIANTANPRELVTSNILFSFFISSITSFPHFLAPIISIVIYVRRLENVSKSPKIFRTELFSGNPCRSDWFRAPFDTASMRRPFPPAGRSSKAARPFGAG